MASIAVVTSSPPAAEGGHMVIGRALVRAAREAGHAATLIVTPDFGFGRTAATYRANRTAGVGAVDQVISLRYPSYAVRHSRHVCWLNHTMREYYDLWPRFSSTLSWKNRIKENARRVALHAADAWLLKNNVTEVVAQSQTIQRRLADDFAIDADVLWPPPPQRPYRCDGYDGGILVVSRLTPLKRVNLLLEALAEPVAAHVRAVVAGEGESLPDLRNLARSLGVDQRVTFLGRVSDDDLIGALARCTAVCFTPFAEDYGFVAVEAFASRKPVITCVDSGGPAELVTDGVSGFITPPTAASLALALARVADDRRLAESMGEAAAARAAAMTWDSAVRRLMIV
jgi:glycosyltransferase involved in cell wall biosynthesis